MQKGQIARQWHVLVRSGLIGTIKCKNVKLLGSGVGWHTGVIGTIKYKKVKLLGSGMHWHALVCSGMQWGDWEN